MANFFVGQRVRLSEDGDQGVRGTITGHVKGTFTGTGYWVVEWDRPRGPGWRTMAEREEWLVPIGILDQIEEALRPSIEVKEQGWGNSGPSGAQEHHNAVSQRTHQRGADVTPSHQQECEL